MADDGDFSDGMTGVDDDNDDNNNDVEDDDDDFDFNDDSGEDGVEYDIQEAAEDVAVAEVVDVSGDDDNGGMFDDVVEGDASDENRDFKTQTQTSSVVIIDVDKEKPSSLSSSTSQSISYPPPQPHDEEFEWVVVTGASGFIGSHIVYNLLSKGLRVRATVRDLSEKWKYQHLLTFEGAHERLRIYEADLMISGAFDRVVDGNVIAVFHCASPVIVAPEDPRNDLIQPSVLGTLSVLGSCLKAANRGSKRIHIILTSAEGALARDDEDNGYVFSEKDWNTTATITVDPYGVSKMLAEKAAWEFIANQENSTPTSVPAFTVRSSAVSRQNVASNSAASGADDTCATTNADTDRPCDTHTDDPRLPYAHCDSSCNFENINLKNTITSEFSNAGALKSTSGLSSSKRNTRERSLSAKPAFNVDRCGKCGGSSSANVNAAGNSKVLLTTVIPTFSIGPPLSDHLAASVALLRDFLMRSHPFVPHLSWNVVDVRDVAEAHYQVFARRKTGRFLISGESLWLNEWAEILHKLYPNRPIAKKTMPNIVLYAMALVDKRINVAWVRRKLDKITYFDNTKSKTELGLVYRNIEDTFKDTAEELFRRNLVPRNVGWLGFFFSPWEKIAYFSGFVGCLVLIIWYLRRKKTAVRIPNK